MQSYYGCNNHWEYELSMSESTIKWKNKSKYQTMSTLLNIAIG